MAKESKLDITTKLYNACVLLLRVCTEEQPFYEKHKEVINDALKTVQEANDFLDVQGNLN